MGQNQEEMEAIEVVEENEDDGIINSEHGDVDQGLGTDNQEANQIVEEDDHLSQPDEIIDPGEGRT